MLQSFREFIDGHWRSPGEMATELGVPVGQTRHWQQRNYIPAEYWLVVEQAARLKKKGRRKDFVRAFARLAAAKNGKATPT